MSRVKTYLRRARRYFPQWSRAQRHAWVRRALYCRDHGGPRVAISCKAPEAQRTFTRVSGIRYGTPLEVGPRVRAWAAATATARGAHV